MRRLIDTLILTVFFTLSCFFIYKHYFARSMSKHYSNKHAVKANEILRKKSKLSAAALNTSLTSSACTLFLKNSVEFSMNEYANQYIDHHIDDILKTCAGALPKQLQTQLDDAVQKCGNSIRSKIAPDCYAALVDAKTKSVATIINPDFPLSELDSTVLLHLVADAFASNDFAEHPEKNLDLIDTLLQKEPDYYNGYKLKLILFTVSNLSKEERYHDMFIKTLNDAYQFNFNDLELKEIKLAYMGKVFIKAFEDRKARMEFIEFLDDESAKFPKEWIYDYYKAHTLYNEGRGSLRLTISLVEKALTKAPFDIRLITTLENLKNDDEVKRNHPFIFHFTYTLNDI